MTSEKPMTPYEARIEKIKLAIVMRWMEWALASAGIKEFPDKLATDIARAADAACLEAIAEPTEEMVDFALENPERGFAFYWEGMHSRIPRGEGPPDAS